MELLNGDKTGFWFLALLVKESLELVALYFIFLQIFEKLIFNGGF